MELKRWPVVLPMLLLLAGCDTYCNNFVYLKFPPEVNITKTAVGVPALPGLENVEAFPLTVELDRGPYVIEIRQRGYGRGAQVLIRSPRSEYVYVTATGERPEVRGVFERTSDGRILEHEGFRFNHVEVEAGSYSDQIYFLEFGVMNTSTGETQFEKIPYQLEKNGTFCVRDAL